MNLIILNTYENQGGAAIATHRIHCGLRSIGINSLLLVQVKKTDNPSVIGPITNLQKTAARLRPIFDNISVRPYRKRENVLFTPARIPEGLATKVAEINPDIVHLFWVADGFFQIETLKKFRQPIVWTLHDMWPFTGGCHYDNECGQFQDSCGNCPILHSSRKRDLSRCVLKRKHKSWMSVPIVIVATSHWLAGMARASSLFKDKRIEVIPNGLDTDRYKPIDKQSARTAYNLPQDKLLILFSAFSATSDKRKGNQYLIQAISKLSQEGWGTNAELVILGAYSPKNPLDLGMKVHFMGNLNDEISQVLLYSAADVLVAPSMQENLSNTVMESLACGTPVVAFDIGGMPDMIDHRINGYLATPFESNDIAEGIKFVVERKDRHIILSQRARQTVKSRFTLKKVAKQYQDLYRDILD